MELDSKLICLFLLYVVAVKGQSIIIPPKNTVGVAGEDVSFTCSLKFYVVPVMLWEFNNITVYNYWYGKGYYPRNNTGKYEVKKNGNETFTLTVNDLELIDGGVYTCKCPLTEAHMTAVLIVLDQPEVIVPEVEEAKITTFICEAHFGGPRKDLISPDQFPQVKMSLNRGGLLRTTVQEFEPNHNITYYTIKQKYYILPHLTKGVRKLKCEIITRKPKVVLTIQKKIPKRKPKKLSDLNAGALAAFSVILIGFFGIIAYNECNEPKEPDPEMNTLNRLKSSDDRKKYQRRYQKYKTEHWKDKHV